MMFVGNRLRVALWGDVNIPLKLHSHQGCESLANRRLDLRRAASGQSSKGPVVESTDLNLVFGHTEATPNKLFFSSTPQIHSRTFLAVSPGLATV
ncbi:hypothetical protein TNCV_2877581 [Trichonephila clavipes]|uniref:Uncharacterized protein n=1 Tax=Trichonephila clavipes TaxID=2585209 RepID=A0A8X6WDU0_TRICX|nr:hypothetical protein TNCV_2877581 [Trichonephila clavipes]